MPGMVYVGLMTLVFTVLAMGSMIFVPFWVRFVFHTCRMPFM
jgi:hypothetical protein